ncbi:hypothetical protein R3Q06_30635, partial [Rhodococcus erythropolis]|uniref:hypothetical protein n=1 Tax=Rhodococcus erythropolis TaxID=1833 RepID=UPI002949943A
SRSPHRTRRPNRDLESNHRTPPLPDRLTDSTPWWSAAPENSYTPNNLTVPPQHPHPTRQPLPTPPWLTVDHRTELAARIEIWNQITEHRRYLTDSTL